MRKRIFYGNNTVIFDHTVSLNNYFSGNFTSSFIAAEDYIYIGSRLPFNHFYLNMGATVNAESADLTVSYWSDSEWLDAVEVIDETATGGATLAQSGFISFTPDKDNNWTRENTNYGGESITGLTDVEIYDLYWMRLSVDADLTADMVISWLGQKFSDDNDLGSEHAEVTRSNFIAAFEDGKTSYEEQAIKAAEIVENDLISRKMITHNEQILDRYDLRLASVSKVAELIYNDLGDDYVDKYDNAKREYQSRIGKSVVKVDRNSNALLDKQEDRVMKGFLYR